MTRAHGGRPNASCSLHLPCSSVAQRPRGRSRTLRPPRGYSGRPSRYLSQRACRRDFDGGVESNPATFPKTRRIRSLNEARSVGAFGETSAISTIVCSCALDRSAMADHRSSGGEWDGMAWQYIAHKQPEGWLSSRVVMVTTPPDGAIGSRGHSYAGMTTRTSPGQAAPLPGRAQA